MYYPSGWHKVLNVDTNSDGIRNEILSIQSNHERELFFILTTRSIHLWNSRPPVEIVSHRRSNESVDSIGTNRIAVWKTDSDVIVVATDRDQLLFYQVRRRIVQSSSTNFILPGSSEHDGIYRLNYDKKNLNGILSRGITSNCPSIPTSVDSIPALTIYSFGKLDLSSIGVSCLLSAEEELIVGARNGDIYGVFWDGNVDNKFPWSLSKELEKGSDYIVDIKFSSILSGFALVFSSGRAGFMPLKLSNELETNEEGKSRESSIYYLKDESNATCAEINHRYRLICFGLKNSKVVVCNINDSNQNLVINHTLDLGQTKFPYDASRLGSVRIARYSPDSFVLATSWEGGHFAIWSVFGSLLFCSQQWQSDSELNQLTKPTKFSSLAWGQEGYNIWMLVNSEDDSQESLSESSSHNATNGIASSLDSEAPQEDVIILPICHSTLSSSPHLTCSTDSIILIDESRLFVGASVPNKAEFDRWLIVDIPQIYMNSNYPIRYATVDRNGKNIAIAGNKGFALYSIECGKWKFFLKKSHENVFSICGDLIWWQDYLVASCYNFQTDSFELRAYLVIETLENENCIIQNISMEIIRMSIFENRLLALYSDGTLGMFMLNLRRKPNFKKPKSKLLRSNSIINDSTGVTNNGDCPSPRSTRSDSTMSLSQLTKKIISPGEMSLQIFPIENLIISNLQANSYCISSIALTRLHFKNNRQDDSILLNACGKLFLLEREAPPHMAASPSSDLSSPDLKDLSLESQKSNDLVQSVKRLSNTMHLESASLKNAIEPSALSNVTFKAVSVIATNVEQFWISPEISNASDMSYFKKSLWLSCGGFNNSLQVWLPLLNDKDDPPTDLYVPDRIMLPIRCDIYPLAIRSSDPDDESGPDDAIVLGAESDVLFREGRLFTQFPYCTVKRQCRVYLHRILRELLLNQHLGYYARKIAESCQMLPYFAHCFELLLHEVLEEEATSPVPLPDPMLPQIVRFIKEFPVYLDTVVHCARKSELSMWSYLFDERAVGNPRRLFQECLEQQKLDTAASCLIILQSLDRNIVSQRMVRELIKAAKEDPKYNHLIEDLENFLLRAELDCMSVSGTGSPS